MPAKLDRCVKHVQSQGKGKSSAYAICSKSTGYVKSGLHSWEKVAEPARFDSAIKFLRGIGEQDA